MPSPAENDSAPRAWAVLPPPPVLSKLSSPVPLKVSAEVEAKEPVAESTLIPPRLIVVLPGYKLAAESVRVFGPSLVRPLFVLLGMAVS